MLALLEYAQVNYVYAMYERTNACRDRNSAELRTYCSEKTSTATTYNNLFKNYGISNVGKIASLLPVALTV